MKTLTSKTPSSRLAKPSYFKRLARRIKVALRVQVWFSVLHTVKDLPPLVFRRLTPIERLNFLTRMTNFPLTKKSGHFSVPAKIQSALLFLSEGVRFDEVTFYLKDNKEAGQFELAFGFKEEGVPLEDGISCAINRKGDFLWCGKARIIDEPFATDLEIKGSVFQSKKINQPEATSLNDNEKNEKDIIFRLDSLLQVISNLRERQSRLN